MLLADVTYLLCLLL